MIHNIADERLQEYLLGELPDEEQREVEERLMTDDEYFRGLLAAEDELIDAYVLGGLNPNQRAQFEKHFLCTPERSEGVRFAAAFRTYLNSESGADASSLSDGGRETPSWFRLLSRWLNAQPGVPKFAALGLALAVVLGASGLIFRVVQLQREVEQLRSTRAQSQVHELEQQLAVERERGDRLSQELQREQAAHGRPDAEPTPPDTEAQFSERAALTQASGTQIVFVPLPGLQIKEAGPTAQVSIPPGTQAVELVLTLPANDYQTCSAILTSEGQELKRWESVTVRKAGGDSTIFLSLPASLLPPGSFLVKLSAPGRSGEPEPIGAYYFRVVE